MFAEAFFLALGASLAQDLAKDAVRELGTRIGRGFREPEVDRALEAASYLINRNETSTEAVELCLEAEMGVDAPEPRAYVSR